MSNVELDLLIAIGKMKKEILKEYTETVIPYGLEGNVPVHVSEHLKARMNLNSLLTEVYESVTGEKMEIKKETNARLYLFGQQN